MDQEAATLLLAGILIALVGALVAAAIALTNYSTLKRARHGVLGHGPALAIQAEDVNIELGVAAPHAEQPQRLNVWCEHERLAGLARGDQTAQRMSNNVPVEQRRPWWRLPGQLSMIGDPRASIARLYDGPLNSEEPGRR
jgi:hypothetical protein